MVCEEAKNRIKKRFAYWALDDEDLEALESLIPELAESEDERIRKHIIKILDSLAACHWDGNEKAKCIAYLEKQKEQKHAERVEINKSLSDAVITELGKYNGENYWKSPWAIDSTGLQYPLYFANLGAKWQKEQKPVEWSEEDDGVLGQIITAFHRIANGCEHYFSQDTARVFEEKLKSLRPQPKQEWSEEDAIRLEDVITLVEHRHDKEYNWFDYDDLATWLKSLRPQPKQEWSELENR